MRKRVFTVASFVCAIVLGLALFSPPAAAQDQDYYTYVSFWAVPRSQWAAFEKERAAQQSTMQGLIANGTIVAWGADEVRVHQEDGYTHEDWFIAHSRAALLKALEVQWPGATSPSFAATTKHHDLFLHTIAHGGNTISGASGYLRVALWQAKPGEGHALEAHVLKYIKPVLDSEVANGTILMYNFDEEDIHTNPPGAYNLAIIYPNGEALDKFYTSLAAAEKENPAVGQLLVNLTVSEAHRDIFSRVVYCQHK